MVFKLVTGTQIRRKMTDLHFPKDQIRRSVIFLVPSWGTINMITQWFVREREV